MFKVIQNNKSDFLHIGRLQQKKVMTVGISKTLVGTKIFLPAANLHGHELQVLVKMYTTDRKFYKDSLGKLTYFVFENFYNHFLFLFQLQVIIMQKLGECINLMGSGVGGRGRFGHFLTDWGSTNPTRL